jgi:hypothetical protein
VGGALERQDDGSVDVTGSDDLAKPWAIEERCHR